MRTKNLLAILFSLMLVVATTGCSKNEDIPDYSVSLLSGDYGKESLWKLDVIINGEQTETDGIVKFYSSKLEYGDFSFLNVIPGVADKTFKNIPLTEEENGIGFKTEFTDNDRKIEISGTINFGAMTVNLKL